MISPDTALIAMAAYAAGIATAVGAQVLWRIRFASYNEPIPMDWVPRDLPVRPPAPMVRERRPSPYAPKSHTKPLANPPARQTHWPAPEAPPAPKVPTGPAGPAGLPDIDWGAP